MATPAKKSRKTQVELSVAKKAELIRFIESGHSQREAAKEFCVSKTTAGQIMTEKTKWLELFSKSDNPDCKRQQRETLFSEINNCVQLWFQRARAIGIPVLQEIANFAGRMKVDNFSASNGWLEAFKLRNGIKQRTISGMAFFLADIFYYKCIVQDATYCIRFSLHIFTT